MIGELRVGPNVSDFLRFSHQDEQDRVIRPPAECFGHELLANLDRASIVARLTSVHVGLGKNPAALVAQGVNSDA